jgi:hypothetical protein
MGQGATYVEAVVNEDHDHHSSTQPCVLPTTNFISSGQDGPDNESAGHANGADEHNGAPAQEVNEEREHSIDHQRPGTQATVDAQLVLRVVNPDLLKDQSHVIPDEPAAGPLLEQAHGHNEHEPFAVSRSPEEVTVARALSELFIERESGVDLVELEADKLVVLVALGMVVRKDLFGTFTLVSVDIEARRFRHKVHQRQNDQGTETLEERWQAPRPVTVDPKGTTGLESALNLPETDNLLCYPGGRE